MHALDCLDLHEKTFLDLGSADGCLSLLVYQKGAQAFLVDMDPRMGGKLTRHIKTNDFSLNSFVFIAADVGDHSYILKRIPRNIEIATANLGSHYSDADIKAIELADRLPNLHTLVVGGYTDPTVPSYYLAKWNPIRAMKAMKQRGFNIFEKVYEDTLSGCPRLTIIARR